LYRLGELLERRHRRLLGQRQLLSRGRQLFVGRAGARHLRRRHHLVLVLPGLRALLVQWRELLRGELQQPRL